MSSPKLRILQPDTGNGIDVVRNSITVWLNNFDADNSEDWQIGFEVARRVQRGLFDASVKVAETEASEYVNEVRALADRIGLDPDDLANSYEAAWSLVRYPYGQGICERAFALAERHGRQLPLQWKIASPMLRRQAELLVLTIGYLHQKAKAPAFLSARKAGELLGVHHTYAANILRNLIRSKDLIVTTAATKTSARRYSLSPGLQRTESQRTEGTDRTNGSD